MRRNRRNEDRGTHLGPAQETGSLVFADSCGHFGAVPGLSLFVFPSRTGQTCHVLILQVGDRGQEVPMPQIQRCPQRQSC